MEEKLDRRIIKTKRAIREAFAELVKIKAIEDITIKDISDKADISRKTFYYHYDGVWEIIDEIENEVTATFEKMVSQIDFDEMIKDPSIIFNKINIVINQNLDFFEYLLINDKNSTLITKFCSVLEKNFRASIFTQYFLGDKVDIISKYCLAGMFAIYQDWFNSDRKQSLDELSKDLSKIMFYGINGILN